MPNKLLAPVALVASSVLLLAPAASAADDEARQFVSRKGANPTVRVVVDEVRTGAPVDVGIIVQCGGFDLNGRFDTTLQSKNRIHVQGDLDGGGSDTYEMKLDLDGRLAGSGFSGTAKVEGRAFDEEGDTGSCDEHYDWSARPAPTSGLGATRAEIHLSNAKAGDVLLASSRDAVYAVSSDPAHVRSIDPKTDRVAWELDVEGAVDAVAATDDALWLLDAAAGVVRRVDPGAKSVVATVDVGQRDANPPYPFEDAVVAVGDDAWASSGTGRELLQIDGSTNTVARTLDLPGRLDAVASNGAALYANVIELAPEVERTGDEPVRLLRIDPTTGRVTAQRESDVSVKFAVDRRYVWTLELLETVERDARTLESFNRAEVYGSEGVTARPGVWVRADDRLLVLDHDTAVVGEVSQIGQEFAALTASFDSVWVWDAAGDAVLRLATH